MKKIGKENTTSHTLVDDTNSDNVLNTKVIITISREYGSGGRYIGRLVADKLGIKFYDKDLIKIVSKEAGMTEDFIEENEQKREWGSSLNSEYNSNDKLFIAETKVIKEIASNQSCVIIGRCSDFILQDRKNVFNVFVYSDMENRIKRAIEFYGIDKTKAEKEIKRIDKLRANHYKYYTEKEWNNHTNYDICINSDLLGVEKTAEIICNMI